MDIQARGNILGFGACRWLGRLLSLLVLCLSTAGTAGLGGTVFVAGVLVASPAQAGSPLCGAEGQQVCGTKSATSLGRPPNMFECPQGSFFDVGLESCWSCPSGYGRTAEPVNSDKACLKKYNQPRKEKAAKENGKAGCPGGSFWDPVNGGTCWKCPDGFHRTAGHIEAANACAKATGFLGEELHTAIKVSGECPNDSFWDPIDGGTCWRCPSGTYRTASPVNAWDACIRYGDTASGTEVVANKCAGINNAANNSFWDPINGGTCWSCPKEYPIRTTAQVTSNAACGADKIVWAPSRYTPPGVFGIGGMDEALAKKIHDNPGLIDDTARGMAKIIGIDPDRYVKDVWAQLETAPEKSPVLRGIAQSMVMDLLLQGRRINMNGEDTRSAAEQYILDNFPRHYSLLRRHFATEMKQYYDAYTAACNRQKSQSGMSSLFNYGCKAQEPSDLIMHLMGGDVPTQPGAFPGAVVGLSVVNAVATKTVTTIIASHPGTVTRLIFPNLVRTFKRAATKLVEDAALKAGERASARAVALAVDEAAGKAAQLGASGLGGATMIFSVGVEIAIIAGQQAAEIAEQAAKVDQAYRDAQGNMSADALYQWVNTETGFNDVMQYLGLMLVGTQGNTSGVRQVALEHNHPATAKKNVQAPPAIPKVTIVTAPPTTILKGTILTTPPIIPNTQKQNGGQAITKQPQNKPVVFKGRFKIAGAQVTRNGHDLCLGVRGNNPVQGDVVELANCDDQNALPFSILANSYLATKNNLCLDAQGHNDSAEVQLMLWKCAGPIQSQKWMLMSEGQVKSRAQSNLCIQIKGPVFPGDPIILRGCNGSPHQLWKPAM